MKVIDVDTHVVEPASVWDYLARSEQEFRPSILRKETGATIQAHFSGPNTTEYWVIDNYLYGKHDAPAIAGYSKGEFTADAITLDNLTSRLADMDQQRVDIQVIFTSLFLNIRCAHRQAELALTRSYNRWIAERCNASQGRLRWVFVPSLKNPTVSALADNKWIAIETVIDESTVRTLIPKLKGAGAQGIIEYSLNKIIN